MAAAHRQASRRKTAPGIGTPSPRRAYLDDSGSARKARQACTRREDLVRRVSRLIDQYKAMQHATFNRLMRSNFQEHPVPGISGDGQVIRQNLRDKLR